MSMRKITKRCAALGLCAALSLSLAACQENPEGSIVAHKDMDQLISQAAKSGESQVGAVEVIAGAKEYESYQTTIESENLKVKVNVDAQVEVPEVDRLSIYRVAQKQFDQAFLDKVRAELCPDATLYDGAVRDVRTKSQIEQELQGMRQMMAEEEANLRQTYSEMEEMTQEDIEANVQVYKDEWQREIDSLQEAYETAPDELDYAAYPSDGQIHTVEELHAQHPDSEYYEWQYGLSDQPGDSIFYGVSDGKDGAYQSLYVQNNADYGNRLMFRNTTDGHPMTSVLVEETPFQPHYSAREAAGFDISFEEFYEKKGVPTPVIDGGYLMEPDWTFAPVGSTTISFTQEEAQAKAEALLEKLDLSDFKFDEGGQFSELVSEKNENGDMLYDVYYILRYRREMDGVMLTQSSGMKFAEGWEDSDTYRKQMWAGESIEFRINDRGIVGFNYNAPLEITDTVVEGAALKTFDEVKGIFEQMLPVTLGSTDYDNVAKVDKVRLSYSRISEKDSFDTGLVVPVWSFEGTDEAYSGEFLDWTNTGTLLAINAIDGSVIDSNLGY